MPRYPVDLRCHLVEITESRFRKRKSELLFAASIFEVSVNGAGILVDQAPGRPEYRIGQQLTIRVGHMEGVLAIRHIEETDNDLRLGLQFVELSQPLEQLFYDSVADYRRAGGTPLRDHWEHAR